MLNFKMAPLRLLCIGMRAKSHLPIKLAVAAEEKMTAEEILRQDPAVDEVAAETVLVPLSVGMEEETTGEMTGEIEMTEMIETIVITEIEVEMIDKIDREIVVTFPIMEFHLRALLSI